MIGQIELTPDGSPSAAAVLWISAACHLAEIVGGMLAAVEAHATLTQALAAVVSMILAAATLLYAIHSLRTMQRQTQATVAMTTETFRPIIEVLGGRLGMTSQIDFVNKGNGAALNFRWREASTPERWRAYTTNVVAPQERGTLTGEVDWEKGLILAYNSVTHREEIYTRVTFGATGIVSNIHEISQGAAATRQGWTLLDPELALPAFHPDFIRSMPPTARIIHWWRLKRGRERRL